MAVQGQRTTYTAITTENRLARVPDEDMLLLEPNATPLLSFLLGMKKFKVVESPRIEHFEDDYIPQWITTAAQTNANAASTTVTVTDGTPVSIGDLLLVPSGTSSNHEMLLVTAKPSANVLTVTRNVGATGLLTIPSGGGIAILGQAFEEGSDLPTAKTTSPATVINYTQIMKQTVTISGTAAKSKQYASNGNERKRLLEKAMKQFKIQMNHNLIWGKPSETLSGTPGGDPLRTTGGIDHFITTNRFDAGGVLTQKSFETFSRMAMRYNPGGQMLLLASPIVISAINQWGNSYLKTEPGEDVLGVKITKVNTGHGQFMLANDWQLRDGVSGQSGFGGWAFALNMDLICARYLTDRNTAIYRDKQAPGLDRHTDLIMAEVGLQLRHEKRHARMYNVTDYAA